MGWKKLKEHYGIEHIVHVTKKGICIGSSYVSELAVINIETGKIKIDSNFTSLFCANYQDLLKATPDELLAIINEPDEFDKSLPVYTFDGGEIIEKFCEEYHWPNVTNDGLLMFDNVFFEDKKDALDKAIESSNHRLEHLTDKNLKLKRDIFENEEAIAKTQNDIAKLNECGSN